MVTISIQAIPPSVNRLRREFRNPHVYRRLRTEWEWLLVAALSPHHRAVAKEQAKKPGKLWVEVTLNHSRLYDTDNATGSLKPVLDALKNIGFIADDSPERLDLKVAQVKCKRKDAHTTIKIGVVD